jgi:hypothetical protein
MKLWTAIRRIGLAIVFALALFAPAAHQALAECTAGSGTVCPK